MLGRATLRPSRDGGLPVGGSLDRGVRHRRVPFGIGLKILGGSGIPVGDRVLGVLFGWWVRIWCPGAGIFRGTGQFRVGGSRSVRRSLGISTQEHEQAHKDQESEKDPACAARSRLGWLIHEAFYLGCWGSRTVARRISARRMALGSPTRCLPRLKGARGCGCLRARAPGRSRRLEADFPLAAGSPVSFPWRY